MDEFIKVVSLDRVQKTGPIFDTDKLDWYNGYYLRKMVEEKGLPELGKRLVAGGFVAPDFPMEKMEQILPLIYERIVKLSDFADLTDFFWKDIVPETRLLLKKGDSELVQGQLQITKGFLETIPWELAKIEDTIRTLCQTKAYKKSQYFMMLRVAVTGKTATPPLFETMQVVGKDQVLARLEHAIKILKEADVA